MKKTRSIILCLVGFYIIFFLLNIKVTTYRGIDYQVDTIEIPLYLKILDFYDRHYNYKELVKRINKDAKTDKERVMRLFEWTYNNIKKNPPDLPFIDDHVWHIIVRGYGVNDQFSDVFTVLCNYAGLDAFFSLIYAKDKKRNILLSFVRINKRWYAFDPYRGVYFKDEKDELIDIQAIKSNTWQLGMLDKKPEIDYAIFIDNLPSVKTVGLTRSTVQSPFNRLFLEIKRCLSRSKHLIAP